MSESSTEQNLVAESNDTDRKEVIILNKFLNGSYLNDEANIGHEIIDVLLTDNDEIYVYNNPYGSCPNDIGVKGTENAKEDKKEKYFAKYLVLTSKQVGKSFDILYVIELKEKLHSFSRKKDDQELDDIQKKIRNEIIEKRHIYYNNMPLYKIYNEDKTLYVTFKAKAIYMPIKTINITLTEYNFQRNKGYLYSDKFENDFNTLNGIITNGINNKDIPEEKRFERFNPSRVGDVGNVSDENKTFIDLIMKENDEQIYTNILFSLLKDGGLFNDFCLTFKRDKEDFDKNESFKVKREFNVSVNGEDTIGGRVDICGESPTQKVVIENKIWSGLHGLHGHKSQLTTYYEWAKKDKAKAPLCFVVVPEDNKQYIEQQIVNKDSAKMKSIYNIVTYDEIVRFLERDDILEHLKNNKYVHWKLIDQIIQAFKNLSGTKLADLYVQMFKKATMSQND